MQPEHFDLLLVDPLAALCDAWRAEFESLSRVSVHCARFEQLDAFDCLVSPANSFGIMDGGVDLAISEFFGPELMARVQDTVLREYRGEQPVGTSVIVPTGHARHPYLAHTPTMRVPMRVDRTDYAYLAMAAMLREVWRYNRDHDSPIRSVACPGLATATGRMPPTEAARQMGLAFRCFLRPPAGVDWAYAEARQGQVGRGGNQE